MSKKSYLYHKCKDKSAQPNFMIYCYYCHCAEGAKVNLQFEENEYAYKIHVWCFLVNRKRNSYLLTRGGFMQRAEEHLVDSGYVKPYGYVKPHVK